MKKFELTAENKINWFGRTLYRIQACINFVTTNGLEVKEGDLGGFVEKESNLSIDGKAWIWGDAKVYGDASLSSPGHIFNIIPIGENANSLTLFRTKNHSIGAFFEGNVYSLENFKSEVARWNEKYQKVALTALEVAALHIDLSDKSKELKPCPFCGGNADCQKVLDVVICQKCGACAVPEIWNERV